MVYNDVLKKNAWFVKLVVITSLLGVLMIFENEISALVNNNIPAISQVADTNSGNKNDTVAPTTSKMAIITFDDGYKSQFTYAKPILANYGYNASFFIVCNFVGKTAKEMNSSSIVNFIGRGVEQMSWDDITSLYKQGYQIGAHTMNHLRNLTKMSNDQLNYEISQSKQCLVNHGISTTIFAYPYESGKDNATIVAKISKYYSYARSGSYPLMFLHCDHYKAHPQKDCRTFLPNGQISLANKYSILGWSHDGDRRKYSYNDSQMFNRFIQVVNSQDKYNRPSPSGQISSAAESIPIIIYHRVDNSGAPYRTTVSLFAKEMKYLHDNGFKVVSMADLVYNNATNSFYLKNL